jgi:lipopolysaccharide biosynthesis glycosyltransferase
MRINICFASDNNYVQHLGATMASILKNAKADDDLHFYILDGGILEINQKKLHSLSSIKDFNMKFIPVNNEDFASCSLTDNYICIATYYRFMIARLITEIEKLIYLDCDMIVKTSLKELYETDISDYWLAGVEDIGYNYHRVLLKRETKSFYINAGMLLINLKKWCEDDIEHKLFKFAHETTEELVHNDQDVINMVLNAKIKPLDFKWNAQDQCFYKNTWRTHPKGIEIKKASLNPSIIHYTGPQKPWQNSLVVNQANEYLKYARLTPWVNNLPKDSKIVQLAIKNVINKIKQKPLLALSSEFLGVNNMEKRKILYSEIDFSKI